MKYIPKNKKPIPKSLEDHRKSPDANYANYKKKDDLRDILLEEQGYICAYCMQPISKSNMKIEHWAPQSKYPEKELDYYNLLAVCKGQEGQPPELQHCDTKKGNQEIIVNPTEPQYESQIKLNYDGKVYSTNPEIENDLKTLNLNQKFLVKYRKETIDELDRAYRQKQGDIKFLKEKLREYTEKPYKPFARFVSDWLEKKIRKKQNQ